MQISPARRVESDGTRATDAALKKEIRDKEDAACNAGMRNPAMGGRPMPELVEAMEPIRKALLQAIAEDPEPPSINATDRDRDKVVEALGLSAREANSKHIAGKWRYNVVGKVRKHCSDPDRVLRGWLKHGSPMGITSGITPDNLFPLWHAQAEAGS